MARHEASQTPSRQPQTPPAPLTPAWLRAHFDPLPFPARMGALARYARTLTPHAYQTLHHALDAGEPDERHTALFLAVVRRDLDRVAAALADPLLGRRARSAALRLPVPEQALERLALSDIRATRHETFRLLRLSRRHALAARLLPQVYERHGARDAGALLPACPAETAQAWLPRVDPPPGTLNALARTASHAVAEYLAARHEGSSQQEGGRFVRRHRAVASVAARRDPAAALILLERAPSLLTPAGVLSALRRPGEALAVLRTVRAADDGWRAEHSVPAGPLPPSVRTALLELPVQDLAFLAERCPAAGSRDRGPERREVYPDGLLGLLPPTERRRVVESRVVGGRRLRSAPLTTLAALAPSDRVDLVVPWLAKHRGSPWTRARLAAALPLADGEPVLRELVANHRSHHRAVAWPALLACAELEGRPDEFARIAVDCERAWHDQDEVRLGALRQLAGAAPRLLVALPDRVLRDAALTTLQSRDSTRASLAAVERLLRRVVEHAARAGRPDRAAFAAGLLGEVVLTARPARPVTALSVDGTAAAAIWEAVSETARNRPDVTTALAELLAPHLADLPDLDARIREVALTGDDPDLAARAAAAWVRPPHVREGRCAELLALDATFATVPLVLATVAARRTDLLDLVRSAVREGFTGRVRPRAVPWAPKVHPGRTGRWLPRQRDAWSAHHARVAMDGTASLRARADAAALLRDPARLTALAEEAPQPVAAAALVALGEVTDRPGTAGRAEVRDFLLRHAATGGVRGRAALAALRRLLERVPDRDAVALLAPVASATDLSVGARKEAARALGALHDADADNAFEALVAAWDARGQHPDVRAVLARALLPAIDRPGIADRLFAAADEPAVRDAVVHARVRVVPDTKGEPYTAFLVRLVREGGEDAAVAAVRALPIWLTPEATDATEVIAEALVDPGRSRRVWEAAAGQLAWFPSGPGAENAARAAFEALAERARAEDPRVRVAALRRLHACSGVVQPGAAVGRALHLLDALADTLAAVGLKADAAQLTWEAALDAVRRGRHEEHRWERLARLCEAGPGRMPGATAYAPLDLRRARERAALLAAARSLRARATPVSGLLALALVRAGGRGTDWATPWRDELDALRAHDDPDTAMAALLVDPAPRG
ncbi:hypothetical protein [Streptomyces sp. NPDC005209]|uniref:hypothetical protein n=1 Tax=Streptomyces sp. NPDC005209 TaxID=3156715 RepID=UPI0033A2216E